MLFRHHNSSRSPAHRNVTVITAPAEDMEPSLDDAVGASLT